MNSYIKIILFFKKLNIHRGYIKTSVKQKITNKFIFSSRNQKYSLDLNQTVISLYTVIKLVEILKQKNSIIVVGNIENISYIDSFKNNNLKNIIFIQKWIPGLISNWEGFQKIIKGNLPFFTNTIKVSQKLRFFRFFYTLFDSKQPSIVIIFQNEDYKTIIKECFHKNIPVILIGNNYSEVNEVSYQVPSNITNFFSYSLFIQLLVGQITFDNNKKNDKK